MKQKKSSESLVRDIKRKTRRQNWGWKRRRKGF